MAITIISSPPELPICDQSPHWPGLLWCGNPQPHCQIGVHHVLSGRSISRNIRLLRLDLNVFFFSESWNWQVWFIINSRYCLHLHKHSLIKKILIINITWFVFANADFLRERNGSGGRASNHHMNQSGTINDVGGRRQAGDEISSQVWERSWRSLGEDLERYGRGLGGFMRADRWPPPDTTSDSLTAVHCLAWCQTLTSFFIEKSDGLFR